MTFTHWIRRGAFVLAATAALAVSLASNAADYITKSGQLYDPATGARVGVIDNNGREQLVPYVDSTTGQLRAGATGVVTVMGQANSPVQKTDADAVESAALFVLNLPANSLGLNSSVHIRTRWSLPAGVSVRLRARFGGVVMDDLTVTGNVTLIREFDFGNRNSLSSQIANPLNAASIGTFSASAMTTAAVDFGTAQQLTITAQFPVSGSGSNVARLESIKVLHYYGN